MGRMHRRAAAAGLLTLLLAAAVASGGEERGGQALRPRLAGAALAAALREGGYVVLMRHTSTEPVAPDPGLFDIEDCATQRNLSEQGRREAAEIGRAFEKLGIRVGGVLTSPYCRCLETAKLAFGRAEPSELLSAFDRLPSPKKDERGAEIRQLLATPPPAGANTVLITHTGTLLYSFGLDTTPEGIAHVFRPGPAGTAQYVARVTPDEWQALATQAP
jgi:phosphohistidine phosphatase SixA